MIHRNPNTVRDAGLISRYRRRGAKLKHLNRRRTVPKAPPLWQLEQVPRSPGAPVRPPFPLAAGPLELLLKLVQVAATVMASIE